VGSTCRLKRDQVVYIDRLAGCENFVGEREEYIYSMRSCRDLRIGII